jgi:hypothetical protein
VEVLHVQVAVAAVLLPLQVVAGGKNCETSRINF